MTTPDPQALTRALSRLDGPSLADSAHSVAPLLACLLKHESLHLEDCVLQVMGLNMSMGQDGGGLVTGRVYLLHHSENTSVNTSFSSSLTGEHFQLSSPGPQWDEFCRGLEAEVHEACSQLAFDQELLDYEDRLALSLAEAVALVALAEDEPVYPVALSCADGLARVCVILGGRHVYASAEASGMSLLLEGFHVARAAQDPVELVQYRFRRQLSKLVQAGQRRLGLRVGVSVQ